MYLKYNQDELINPLQHPLRFHKLCLLCIYVFNIMTTLKEAGTTKTITLLFLLLMSFFYYYYKQLYVFFLFVYFLYRIHSLMILFIYYSNFLLSFSLLQNIGMADWKKYFDRIKTNIQQKLSTYIKFKKKYLMQMC